MSERRAVRIDFETQAVGKMRNEVSMTAPWGSGWEMATDEGGFHGGDDTAPPPLAYFATGFAGCFLTQVRAFAKRMDIQFSALSTSGYVEWWIETDGRKPYTTGPQQFAIDLNCETTASTDRLIELVEAAKRGCFVEQSLVSVPIKHRINQNGQLTEVD